MSVHTVRHGMVNSFVVLGAGVTLIDTGPKGGEQRILEELADLARGPRDVKRIIVTHHHADHAAALARLKAITGAPVYMHRVDAELVRQGIAMRPSLTAVFPLSAVIPLARRMMQYTPAEVEHEVDEGDVIEDGFRVLFTPGHSAGQVSLLREGFLFAGDAAANLRAPGPAPIFEDRQLARESFHKVAALDFEGAGFGHGRTLESRASARFRSR